MKRVAILLAGLALGTTSPAMADIWAPGRPVALAAQALQLAQNDDNRDRRGKGNREERGEPQRGQREAPQREAPQREGGGPREAQQQREAQQREAQQREAAGRDPRDVYGRQGRPGYDPREAYGRDPREGPQAYGAPPPQVYARPRLSEQSAIGAISRRFPGGRLLDSQTVTRNGRTYYSVRYMTRGGARIDSLVDAETGAIMEGG